MGKIREFGAWRRGKTKRHQTHKHCGFGGFAQPQVLEPIFLVLAPLRELFHPGLGGLRRGPRRGGEAAQQAHDPGPLRGLPGAAGISARPRGSGTSASSGLRWRNRTLKNRPVQERYQGERLGHGFRSQTPASRYFRVCLGSYPARKLRHGADWRNFRR